MVILRDFRQVREPFQQWLFYSRSPLSGFMPEAPEKKA
jgi:hypothetical protein